MGELTRKVEMKARQHAVTSYECDLDRGKPQKELF